jgi:hypothetical protein
VRRVVVAAGVGLAVTAVVLPMARAATSSPAPASSPSASSPPTLPSPSSGAPSPGSSAPTPLGFGTSAVANAATLVFFDPNAPVPASPTAEADADHSEAALQSGPVGRALASTAWPGALIAGLGPALGLLLPVNPGLGAYPVRAQASYPQGASSATNDSIPGNTMAASAAASGVSAAATSGGADVPAVVVQGTLHSEVHESSIAGIVNSAMATATNVTILNGLVHIDSVTSNATVRNGASRPVLTGDTQVSGLTVAGVPVTVDATGARIGNGPTASGPTGSAQSLFGQMGITVSVAKPIDMVSGNHAERLVGGVLVAIDARVLSAYVASLPLPEAQEISATVNAKQQLLVGLGEADVTLDTVSGAAPSITVPTALVPPAASTPAGSIIPSSPAASLGSPTGQATTQTPVPPRGAVGTPPAAAPATFALRLAKQYRGLLPWDIAVAALLALAAAAPIWRLTTGALDPDALPEECPLETRKVGP